MTFVWCVLNCIFIHFIEKFLAPFLEKKFIYSAILTSIGIVITAISFNLIFIKPDIQNIKCGKTGLVLTKNIYSYLVTHRETQV